MIRIVLTIALVLIALGSTASAWNDFDYWWNQPVTSYGGFMQTTNNWYNANGGLNGPLGMNFWAPQNGNWASYMWVW